MKNIYSGFNIEELLEKAFNYIKNGANLGFDKAYFWLGYMYFKGEGTGINDKEAVKYLLKAIKVDNDNTIMAEYTLGMIYLEGNKNGIDVEENKECQRGRSYLTQKRGRNIIPASYVSIKEKIYIPTHS